MGKHNYSVAVVPSWKQKLSKISISDKAISISDKAMPAMEKAQCFDSLTHINKPFKMEIRF